MMKKSLLSGFSNKEHRVFFVRRFVLLLFSCTREAMLKAIFVDYSDVAAIQPQTRDTFANALRDAYPDRYIILDISQVTGEDRFDAVAAAERKLQEVGFPPSWLVRQTTGGSATSVCGARGLSVGECVVWRRKSFPSRLAKALEGQVRIEMK
jgi:hypothetical protein